MGKIAVILSNMGGPDNIQAIPEYLENIFNDPDIIDIPLPIHLRKILVKYIVKKRSPKTEKIYQKIGGASPLTKITEIQAQKLSSYLNENSSEEFKIFIGMRYWKPFLTNTWQEILDQKFEQIIIFSQYPQYSTTTTGSIENLLKNLLKKSENFSGKVEIIKSYCDNSNYIQAIVNQIELEFSRTIKSNEFVDLIFSAHAIPLSRINKGDPYENEIEKTFLAVKKFLPKNVRMHKAYQSKLGPVKWLGPDIESVIADLARLGRKKIFIYPVSFVTDNSETVYEIDMLYRDFAHNAGIRDYYCFTALNTNPDFIKTMAEIILNTKSDNTIREVYEKI